MTQPGKPRPSSPPLVLTADDLDMAAAVTPFDVLMARALWQRFCPARYLDMLDALGIQL